MNTLVLNSLGAVSTVGWLIAYVLIIWRSFKDKVFGMPVAALAANLSWEASYGFLYEPLSNDLHRDSIAWFFADVPIVVQCFMYGAKDFRAPFVKRHFKLIFVAAIGMALPLMRLAFEEFHDPKGLYTGFGINFMMSILFVAMLARRDGIAGQSVYIAIFKWIGTLFAYAYTVFEAITSAEHPWPSASFVQDTVMHQTYPLTPTINFLYLFVFVLDVLYIVLVYRKAKECGVDPWRRA
ncbi:hypothetical protein [Pendulispora albinea]|uniref:Integral membrane protein n=1 Tax=Pendulispora albinea TaxID=2741071 RepID=A0ABZ2LUI6_9BACT